VDDIETILATLAIERLKARYFRCMDTKDWAGFEAVFAPDAVMDMQEEAGDVIRGASAIAAYVRTQVGDVETVHHGHMPEIEVTGPDTARGTWAMFDFVEWPASDSGERVGLNGYGHYLEEYAREDGEWRIARIRLERLRVDRLT
jgi:hypothetical protein